MKIRFGKNTIRIRLSKDEILNLPTQKKLVESTYLPQGQAFKISLSLEKQFTALLHDHELAVHIPDSEAMIWLSSNDISLVQVLDLPNKQQLKISVEKDIHSL